MKRLVSVAWLACFAFVVVAGGGLADTCSWTLPDGRRVIGESFFPQTRSSAPAVLVVSPGGFASSHVTNELSWRLDDGQTVVVPRLDVSETADVLSEDILVLAADVRERAQAPIALDAEGELVPVAARAFARGRSGLFAGFWMTNPPRSNEGGWRSLVSGSVGPDGSVVPNRTLPDLMQGVTTKAAWERDRRPEVLKAILENEFGVRPVERPSDLRFRIVSPECEVLSGRAVSFLVRGSYSGPGGSAEINFRVFLPKRTEPAPVFVHLAPRPSDTAADPAGPRPHYVLPAEMIVKRGYAAISFDTLETAQDWKTITATPTGGVLKVFGPADLDARKPEEWGIISAWSWGVSRVIDWIETEPRLDARRIAVVGLSRNGKAALATGAQDTRVALTVSCCSGTGGAKLNHADLPQSEHLRDMSIARYWFAPRFWDWVDRDAEMPVDQHWLLALVAPRLLYVSSAADDSWAGQPGEFESARLASEVWTLYGLKGLVCRGYPKTDEALHDGCVGYHRRSGPHTIRDTDWKLYLDFAERHGW